MATEAVTRYRATVANLLADSVATTHELERLILDGTVDGAHVDLVSDPSARGEAARSHPGRLPYTLLLRKARIHTAAVLWANDTNNLHSLGVQMRPVLECAGQVVFVFHHLIVAPNTTMDPERAVELLGRYSHADYYRTVMAATKGKVGHNKLLENISVLEETVAASVGMPMVEIGEGRTLRQAGKVATLAEGKILYDHLSDYFCHGRVDWRGHSWLGGVVSTDSDQDVFAFAILMNYLVEQVAVMNAYAALLDESDGRGWVEATLKQLHEAREASNAVRDAAEAVLYKNAGVD